MTDDEQSPTILYRTCVIYKFFYKKTERGRSGSRTGTGRKDGLKSVLMGVIVRERQRHNTLVSAWQTLRGYIWYHCVTSHVSNPHDYINQIFKRPKY
jgi:hypothetical protein